MNAMPESLVDIQAVDPQVFISYAKEDARRALKLYARLKDDGFTPWIDTHNILPGYDWESLIESVISRCPIVLVCLSEKSISKQGYIQKEMRMALRCAGTMPRDVFTSCRHDSSPARYRRAFRNGNGWTFTPTLGTQSSRTR